jgi:Flp pilus assembly protein TadD
MTSTPPDVQARIDRNRGIVERMPDNHLAHFGLANALLDAGLLGEAEQEYRRCLAMRPDWMAVAVSLGRCLVMAGRHDEARAVLAEARRMAIAQGHSSPLEEIAELEARCDRA